MDNSGNKALRDLGIFYCTVFVISLAATSLALWLYWDTWRLNSLIPALSNVFTVSAGIALLTTILKEAGWYMVLATIKAKDLKEEGRKEGHKEGHKEGIAEGIKEGIKEGEERRQRREDEAYAKFGVEVNGVLMLPRTPEVQRFLSGEPEE